MSLFAKRSPTANPLKLQQIKGWVSDCLSLDSSTIVSISQLRCNEPGCPPVETVIAIMTHPTQTYKIHKAAPDVMCDDVVSTIRGE
ncbi:MAG: hypothetical protein F6K09_14375 [Merismopedia sp. SIO2A8]|nr:hypothetical protein [Merismopedia sp. SIO2A8]